MFSGLTSACLLKDHSLRFLEGNYTQFWGLNIAWLNAWKVINLIYYLFVHISLNSNAVLGRYFKTDETVSVIRQNPNLTNGITRVIA